MGKLNTAVATKITYDDYLLLKQIAQQEFDLGKIREPTVSRLLRVWIKGRMRKWQEANLHTKEDAIIREFGSCYYQPNANF